MIRRFMYLCQQVSPLKKNLSLFMKFMMLILFNNEFKCCVSNFLLVSNSVLLPEISQRTKTTVNFHTQIAQSLYDQAMHSYHYTIRATFLHFCITNRCEKYWTICLHWNQCHFYLGFLEEKDFTNINHQLIKTYLIKCKCYLAKPIERKVCD